MHEELTKRADDIRIWNKGLAGEVILLLVRTETPESRAIEAFIRDLSTLAPRVAIKPRTARAGELPGIFIGESWRLHLVPEGMELDPFLELLSAIARGEADICDDIKKTLKNYLGPILITLFLSTHCPHCPGVMQQIAPLPLIHPGIRLTVIDGLLFPDSASKEGIRAVPTLIGEGGVRWTGQIRLETVIETLVQKDDDGLSKEAIVQMITEGNAGLLADRMIVAGRVFPALLEALTGDLFSTRLGAMVVMEDLGERAPDLARTALEHLWEKMSGVGETIKGDIVYLIGALGDSGWVPRLERLMEAGMAPDLEDAVRDAIETLTAENGAPVRG